MSPASPAERLLARLVSTPAMDGIFSDSHQVALMVHFEVELTGALEDCSLAPTGTYASLAELVQQDFLTVDRATYLRESAPAAGNLVIPFVKLFTEAAVFLNPAAAAFVHTGATSQDVLDTVLALQIGEGLSLIEADLQRLRTACVELAQKHSQTLMSGRTWLQQGPPTTFGLKCATFVAAFDRHLERLTEASRRAVQLQFGGAVGTLASLGTEGPRVSHALARRLYLPEPPLPWHTQRDSIAEVATTLGLLTGTLVKLARDLSLLMQSEVGEALEPGGAGRGGSSTMPHKRNPVGCAIVLSAGVRVPGLVATMLTAIVQEHERGLGGWQAEWSTLPQIFALAAASLSQMCEVMEGLELHPDRMASNLAALHGLLLAEAVSSALAPRIGRAEAHALLEEASRRALDQATPLADILAQMPTITQHLSPEVLTHLLDPAKYLGSTAFFIGRALRAKEGR